MFWSIIVSVSFVISFISFLITRRNLITKKLPSTNDLFCEIETRRLMSGIKVLTFLPMIIMSVIWLIFFNGIVSFISCVSISLSISSIMFYLILKKHKE